MKEENFSIIDRHPNEAELRMLESMHIAAGRPQMNEYAGQR